MTEHKFDWFADINGKLNAIREKFNGIQKTISDIKELKNKIKRTTNADEKANLGCSKTAQETQQRELTNNLESLYISFCDEVPFYYSRIKALSAIYHQTNDEKFKEFLRKKHLAELKAATFSDNSFTEPDLSTLPPFSFFLEFKFSLETPYLSKDDDEFHVCKNPLRKDWVFKVPMVSGSTWKGSLRWAATKRFTDDLATMDNGIATERRLSLIRLFGAEKEGIEKAESMKFEAYLDLKIKDRFGEEGEKIIKQFRKEPREKKIVNKDGFGKGRLYFYPSFFDKIDLEVINPHDRKTKAGTIPVTIESVPVGSTASFRLLYAPLVKTDQTEVLDDLKILAEAIESMMLTYGFSAKKSAGFGIAKPDCKIRIVGSPLPGEYDTCELLKKSINDVIGNLAKQETKL